MLTYSIQIFVCVIKLPWKEIADQQWWHCKIKEEKTTENQRFNHQLRQRPLLKEKWVSKLLIKEKQVSNIFICFDTFRILKDTQKLLIQCAWFWMLVILKLAKYYKRQELFFDVYWCYTHTNLLNPITQNIDVSIS